MQRKHWFETLRVGFRALTFRATQEELIGLDYRHLCVGLVATWLVGIGRHWDMADATLVQASGIVSIAFVVGFGCQLTLAVQILG